MKNNLIIINILLLCSTLSGTVEYETNQYYFPALDTSALLTNFQYKPDYKIFTPEATAQGAKLSRIEILYGRFEHLDANIMIAKYSGGPNLRATVTRIGENILNPKLLKVPAINDPMAAIPKAAPALPCLAI